MDKISLGLVQALARGSSAPAHPAHGTGVTGRAEQSFLLIISSVPGDVGVPFKSRGSAKPSEVLVLLFPQAGEVPVLLPVALLCWLGVQDSWSGGCARCSPWEGAEPPEGMEPAGTLWAGSPCSAHLPLSQGRLICTWSPCLVPPHLPGQQGQAAGLCSLPGDVRAAEGISPPRCAPRAGHSSSPALPAWEATSALQKPWQQRAGSRRRAEPAWET